MAVSRVSFLLVLVFSMCLPETAFCMILKRKAEPQSDDGEETTTEDDGGEETTTEDEGGEETPSEDEGGSEETTDGEGETPTDDGGDGESTDSTDDSGEDELKDSSLSANDDYDSVPSSNGSSLAKGEDNSTSTDQNATTISKASDVDKPFQGGFTFDSPFFSFEQVEQYFRKLERAMENIFRQAMDQFGNNGTNFKNSSDQIVEVDGQKYNVHTTIIKGGDVNSSISIEAISAVPMDER